MYINDCIFVNHKSLDRWILSCYQNKIQTPSPNWHNVGWPGWLCVKDEVGRTASVLVLVPGQSSRELIWDVCSCLERWFHPETTHTLPNSSHCPYILHLLLPRDVTNNTMNVLLHVVSGTWHVIVLILISWKLKKNVFSPCSLFKAF